MAAHEERRTRGDELGSFSKDLASVDPHGRENVRRGYGQGAHMHISRLGRR